MYDPLHDPRRERPGYLKKKTTELPKVPWKEPGRARRAGNRGMPRFLRSGPRLYKHLQGYREQRWYDLVERFEANPDFYNAYHWLCHHPLFWSFRTGGSPQQIVHEKYLVHDYGMPEALDIHVARVDPETNAVSEDPARNTELQVWFEIMFSTFDSVHRTHVYEMDSGAPTYEKAVIKAAKKIHKRYGNDRRAFEKEVEGWRAKSV